MRLGDYDVVRAGQLGLGVAQHVEHRRRPSGVRRRPGPGATGCPGVTSTIPASRGVGDPRPRARGRGTAGRSRGSSARTPRARARSPLAPVRDLRASPSAVAREHPRPAATGAATCHACVASVVAAGGRSAPGRRARAGRASTARRATTVTGHTNPPRLGPSGPRMMGMSPVKSTAPTVVRRVVDVRRVEPRAPAVGARPLRLRADQPHAGARRVVVHLPRRWRRSVVDVVGGEELGRAVCGRRPLRSPSRDVRRVSAQNGGFGGSADRRARSSGARCSTSPVRSVRPPWPPKSPRVKVDALPRYCGTWRPPQTSTYVRRPGHRSCRRRASRRRDSDRPPRRTGSPSSVAVACACP